MKCISKYNSRIIFLNLVTNAESRKTSIMHIDDGVLYFDCEYDEQLLNSLKEQYDKNQPLIQQYLSSRSVIPYELDRTLVVAGCCDLILHNFDRPVIYEYLRIADNFAGINNIIHAALSQFYPWYQQSRK